ncbi:hypothetical protein ACOXXX_00060 [Thalassococcus sp. BH17M4-6]
MSDIAKRGPRAPRPRPTPAAALLLAMGLSLPMAALGIAEVIW